MENRPIRIEFRTYNHYDSVTFAQSMEDAQRIAEGLKQMRHVSDVKIIQPEPLNE